MTEKYKENFFNKVCKTEGCWYWIAFVNQDGYGSFWMDKKAIKAHRASYLLFKGSIPEKMCVCHFCDEPSCVNPEHLWLGTHKENMADMVKKKRIPFGEQRPNNKIPIYLRKEIAEQYKNGMTQLKLAEKYNCSASAIWNAVHHILPVGWNPKGEKHPRSKLKVDDIIDILNLDSAGVSCKEISEGYPVTQQAIRLIVKGKNWSHIKK